MIQLRLIAYALLAAGLIGGGVAYHHHVFEQGVTTERTRRDALDLVATVAAGHARDDLNAQIRALQSNLNAARDDVDRLEKELTDEKAVSTARQADLLAGRARERVLVRTTAAVRPADPVGQAAGAAAADVGDAAGVEVDLDPGVASALEGVRAEHNAAVERLDACVQQYNAVKAAADGMP